MAKAVTIVAAGGVGVTNLGSLSGFGTPMTPVDAGGMAVTLLDAGGLPVVLINEDGTLWSAESLVSAIALAAGGALFNPSDLTSLYQSRTGGSNSTSGSVVGIMLDKSYMGGQTAAAYIAGQAEKLSGSWSMSTGGGTATATESPAGTLNLTGDGTNSGLADKSFTTVANRWYIVTFTVGTAQIIFRAGTSQGGSQLLTGTAFNVGANTAMFMATGTTTWLRFNRQVASLSVASAISVKEIPGFHALAPSDAARPLLTVSGGLSYLVVDGVDDWMNVTPTLNLGEAWWHVGGWRSDTTGRRAFATSSDFRGALIDNSSKWAWRNAADSGYTTLANGSPASVAVVTIQQTSTSLIAGRYNGAADTSFAPYDDSAATQGLALFSQQNVSWGSGLAGRFYGGAFAPGTISAANRAIMERFAATLAGVTLA